jgi:hypothetical protein
MSAPDNVVTASADPGGKANGPCQVCAKEMTFIMPVPRIFNEVDVSVLAIAHPPSKCPYCGTIHLPLIRGISEEGAFQLTWRDVKVNRGPIIAGGGNEALRQAIAEAQFVDQLKKGN